MPPISALRLRRDLLVGAGLALVSSTLPILARAQERKLKVAAIYTVPVEQQWVSRIHKALNAEVARGGLNTCFRRTWRTPTMSG